MKKFMYLKHLMITLTDILKLTSDYVDIEQIKFIEKVIEQGHEIYVDKKACNYLLRRNLIKIILCVLKFSDFNYSKIMNFTISFKTISFMIENKIFKYSKKIIKHTFLFDDYYENGDFDDYYESDENIYDLNAPNKNVKISKIFKIFKIKEFKIKNVYLKGYKKN